MNYYFSRLTARTCAILPESVRLRIARLLRAWHLINEDRYVWIRLTKFNFIVQRGPFAGMSYHSGGCGGSMAAKLLGSYEYELHNSVAALLHHDFDKVINIGCAEGYYAVGLARSKPNTRVFAYEMDVSQRRRVSWLATTNGVLDQLTLLGTCSEELLIENLKGSREILMVCDVEGAELDLLKLDNFPTNCRTWLVVECHKVNGRWTSEELIARFGDSHFIERIDYQPETRAESFKWLLDHGFERSDLPLAILDRREPEQHWLVMFPRPSQTDT
jgi:hypothetical protein